MRTKIRQETEKKKNASREMWSHSLNKDVTLRNSEVRDTDVRRLKGTQSVPTFSIDKDFKSFDISSNQKMYQKTKSLSVECYKETRGGKREDKNNRRV